ncbi:MAG: hypothetical protein ABI862_05335, partial [Ilumatobacteraceae bacterium]
MSSRSDDVALGRASTAADEIKADAELPAGVVQHQSSTVADPKRNHVWVAVVLAAVLFIGGVAASVFAANSVAHRNSERSREALELSAAEVAATLRVAILREDDLATIAAAFYLRT